MGIKKGLLSFIKKKYPTVIKQGHIEDYAGKTIALDIFSFLYRYIHTFGKEDSRWIVSVFKHFSVFKKHKINIIPIFDGKPPVEKNEERNFRKEKKEQEDQRMVKLSTDFNVFLETGQVSEVLEHVNSFLTRRKQQASLFRSRIKNDNKPRIDVYEIQNYIDAQKNKCNYLSKYDITIIKELLTIVKIPFVQAVDEAETLACYLLNKNLCDTLISLDSDCIAYGINNFIIDINQRGNCTIFDVNEFCTQTGLTKEQVTDLCIICQCDYNSQGNGIEGVGPVRAISLLKQHQNIEGILGAGYKEDRLNHVRCREIFCSKYEEQEEDIKNLKFDEEISLEDFAKFINEKDIHINMKEFQDTWIEG
jgi:5'-3' exonuclease